MKTSDDVREAGLYATDCCGEEVIFCENDCFSRCPRCEGLCQWELVDDVISSIELQQTAAEQAA